MLLYANTPILTGLADTGWAVALALIASPEGPGKSAIQIDDAHVLSVQPDGRYETRPLDAIGPYESGTVVDGCWCVVYGTETPTPSRFVIPIKDGV